jgi:hypothetical protein
MDEFQSRERIRLLRETIEALDHRLEASTAEHQELVRMRHEKVVELDRLLRRRPS